MDCIEGFHQFFVVSSGTSSVTSYSFNFINDFVNFLVILVRCMPARYSIRQQLEMNSGI